MPKKIINTSALIALQSKLKINDKFACSLSKYYHSEVIFSVIQQTITPDVSLKWCIAMFLSSLVDQAVKFHFHFDEIQFSFFVYKLK